MFDLFYNYIIYLYIYNDYFLFWQRSRREFSFLCCSQQKYFNTLQGKFGKELLPRMENSYFQTVIKRTMIKYEFKVSLGMCYKTKLLLGF